MSTAVERVRAVRAHVRRARGLSTAASLEDLARASEALQDAVLALRSLQIDFTSTGIADSGGSFRSELALLKREMDAAGRLIDGGSSLYRGLALQISGTGLSYSVAGGTIVSAPTATAVEIRG